MKNKFKFHSVVNKNVYSPALQYLKIGEQFIEGSDAVCLFRIPKKLVFGDCNFEGYIEGEGWKKQGFFNGTTFQVENNFLRSFDSKGKDLGFLKILNQEEINKIGIFPDFLKVFPQSDEIINKIAFNHEILNNLCEAIGSGINKIQFVFSGEMKAIKINTEIKEIEAVLMPMRFEVN